MMKRTTFIILLIIISILLFSMIAFANTPMEQPTSVVTNEKLFKALAVIGLGFAAGTGALGIGLVSRAFIEGIYRNPETLNKMLIWFFVAFALIEAQVLYTLFFVFQLFFAKG